MKADTETKKELSDIEHIRLMTESRGWLLVYESLTNKILDLQNINNVDVTTPEAAISDLKARKMAADTLWAWAKAEVYGRIEQGQNAQNALEDKQQSQFITRQ